MTFNDEAKKILKLIYENLDMDFAMEETEKLFQLEYGQTFENYEKSSKYVYDLLQKEGFAPQMYSFPADGKTTYQDKRMPIGWSATKGRLTVVSSPVPFDEPVVADFEKIPVSLIKHSVSTPQGGIRVKLVTEEQVFAGEDCTGAMVLINGRAGTISEYLDLGALGVVSDYLTGDVDYPDDVYWANACTDDNGHWHVQSEDRDFIGFMVSPRVGRALRAACSKGVVEVLVESDGRRYDTTINAVTATLPGKTNKEFWLLAHLYEPTPSDNSMGVIGAIAMLKCIRDLSQKGVIPMPDCTVRVLFAMELYGYSALYEALGKSVTQNVLGGLDVDGIPETDKTSYLLIYPPYSSPFFATPFMKSACEIYSEVFPNTETVTSTFVQFTDDTFLGDSTTGVPTIWFLYDADSDKSYQHNTCVKFSWLDKEKYARALSVLTLVTALSVSKIISVEKMLENALRHAEEKIAQESAKNQDPAYLSVFKAGEKRIILDFKKISDSPLVDAYAQKIDDAYVPFENESLGMWQGIAKTIVPKRETVGLPYDRIRAPKNDRKTLPDRVIYGPFGLVLSAMDGEKDLERIIRECLWETGESLCESTFREYVNGVYYLAKYGYLSLKEQAPITEQDLVSALKQLGIEESDVVLLHSALSGCGHVQGGADAIINAFLACANTVIAPSFTRPYIAFEGKVNRNRSFRPYDRHDFENICTGAIPKAMLKRGAKRSDHATHSWCGFGEKVDELFAAQSLLDPPVGETSPFTAALKLKAKVVLYGVSASPLTFLHYLEDKANVAYLENAVVKVKDETGKISTEVIHRHLPGCRDFYSLGFDSKMMTRAKQMGLEIKSVKYGAGSIYAIDLNDLYEKGMKIFENDPFATLCDNPNCAFCRRFY